MTGTQTDPSANIARFYSNQWEETQHAFPAHEIAQAYYPTGTASRWPADEVRAVLPQQNAVDVPAGWFDYTDSDGKAHHALFIVHTVANDTVLNHERPQDDEKRQDDLNEQYVLAYDQLMAQGAERIRYTEVSPSPFF